MERDPAGRRRLLVALAAAVALIAALVALQLVDDDNRSAKAASLAGTVSGARGWRIEIAVVTPDTRGTGRAGAHGHYVVRDLTPGPAQVSWIARASDTTTGDGVSVASQRSGRTQITLDAGRNTYDISL